MYPLQYVRYIATLSAWQVYGVPCTYALMDEETESREYFTAVSDEILRPSHARVAVECKKDE